MKQMGYFLFFDFCFFIAVGGLLAYVGAIGLGQGWPGFDHLGAEYFHIAQSLAYKGSFSDPFVESTGPTAWMPPFLPFAMALILSIGSKHLLIFVMLTAQLTTNAIAMSWVVYEARRLGMSAIGRFVAFAFCVADANCLFETTEDCFLLLGFSSLSVLGLIHLYCNKNISAKVAIGWGMGGGLMTLASPTCGLTWAILTVFAFRKNLKRLWISGAISFLCVLPWIARNQIVFGAFVPIKSNAGFEAWQANVIDEDGVIDRSSSRPHPNVDGEEHRRHIRDIGEVAYCYKLGSQFFNWVQINPIKYLQKIVNRISRSTIAFENTYFVNSHHWLWKCALALVHASPWLLMPIAFLMPERVDKRYWILVAWVIIYLMPYCVSGRLKRAS